MRSFLLNFLAALLVFGGIFWYYYSAYQAETATMADRYGMSAPSATAPVDLSTPAPASAAAPAATGVPTIDTGAKQ